VISSRLNPNPEIHPEMSLNNPKKIALAWLALAGLSNLCQAAVIYVSNTGSDSSLNPYNINTPIYSINKASNIAVPGDVIKLRGTGVGPPYKYAWQQYFSASGTSTQRITIESYNGEWAVLDGSNQSDTGPVLGIAGSYVTVRNLQIQYAKQQGLTIWNSKHNLVSGCNINNSQLAGIFIGGNDLVSASDNTIDNCRVWNNCRMNQARTLTGGWPAGISSMRAANTTVINCEVFQNWGEGIGYPMTNGGAIDNNDVHDNFSVNIYLDNTTNVEVTGNTVINQNKTFMYRNGNPATGIQMANEAVNIPNPCNNNIIFDNIIGGGLRGIAYGNYQNGGGILNTIISFNTVSDSWYKAAEIQSGTHTGSALHDNTFIAGTGTNATVVQGTGVSVYSNTYQ
jgi:hypothetical protein